MKKKIVALAALSAIAGAAQAQSSVTLYGIVDAAYRYSTNHGPQGDDSLNTLIGGGMSQSRWGFNVNEDLGGGLRALANLEQRFTTDNGNQVGGTWQQSWVGVQSSSWGRLTAGKQYNVLFDVTTGTFASFKYSPYIEAYKPEIAMALGVRHDNSVKYALTLGGFTGELQVAAGEGGAASSIEAVTKGKAYGAMGKYTFGAFSVGGGYILREFDAEKEATGWVVGGAWTSGPWYVHASYAKNDLDPLLTSGGNPVSLLLGTGVDNTFTGPGMLNAESRTLYNVGLTYQLTPALNLGAAYWYLEQDVYNQGPFSVSTAEGSFFAFVAQYAFSKRTDAYVGVDFTSIDGGVRNDPLGTKTTFAGGADDRTGFMVGLRHRF